MLKWCIDALGGVSGINPELLGSTTGDVPGVAQRQRQIQGMTINAGYFSALTRYLREEARLVFEFIRNFVADGRLIRLGGPFNARAIPLLHEHLPVDYDLVIDEPAKSPNAKEVFWEKMAPIIPMLIKANAFLPEILDYSPFPASIAAKLKQQLVSRTPMPAPEPASHTGKDPREVQASVAQKSAAAELALARARDIDSPIAHEEARAGSGRGTGRSKAGSVADAGLNRTRAVRLISTLGLIRRSHSMWETTSGRHSNERKCLYRLWVTASSGAGPQPSTAWSLVVPALWQSWYAAPDCCAKSLRPRLRRNPQAT
ncbi:MAG: hypothetical protein ACLQU2_19950 [Candidatus Binataceae bacterium]